MAKSHPQGKLQFMAINHRQECSEVFPRVGRNAKGSHARPTPGSTVNEENGINAEEDKDLDAPPHDSKWDILITVYNLRNTM
jgi:hypothetical protein